MIDNLRPFHKNPRENFYGKIIVALMISLIIARKENKNNFFYKKNVDNFTKQKNKKNSQNKFSQNKFGKTLIKKINLKK